MEEYDLEDVLLEEQVLEFLGITRSALDSIRLNEKLPFIKVNDRNRMYLKADLTQWLITKRITLNTAI